MNRAIGICAVLLMLSAGMASSCSAGSQIHSVYVMTNTSSGNAVLDFSLDAGGSLSQQGSVATQGSGSGGSVNPLNSQGALALTRDNKWILAVNAGSNEISVFGVSANGLKFASKTSSLGQFPISVAVSSNLVAVLNQKSVPPNITAFTLDHAGILSPVADGVRMLPSGTYSQVGFSPDGRWLVVAGGSNNLLLVYSVKGSNLTTQPFFAASNGPGPAAFTFDKSGHLLVAEAAGNSVSSYSISSNGLKTITASLPSGQKTPNWIVSSGSYAYTVNQSSGWISAYAISTSVSGQITLANSVAAAAIGPSDMAISSDGQYLYILDPGAGTIDTFQIEKGGSLNSVGNFAEPFGISGQGIAAS